MRPSPENDSLPGRSAPDQARLPRGRPDAAYLFALPAVLGCLIFTVYPVLFNFYMSQLKWDLLSGTKRFVALENFVKLLGSPAFRSVLSSTALYMTVVVGVSVSVALVLAVAVNRRGRLAAFAQTAIFTPHIISLVSVSILWMWIMDPEYGLLNFLLGSVGLPPLMWLENPRTAPFSLMLVGIWKTVGYNTLLIIAGLQSIPPSIYESARLDKSRPLTTFFRITFPLLSPTLFFVLVVNIASSFQVFDSVLVMTQGGPLDSTNLLVHWIYQTGFEYYRVGEAATGAVFLFAIVAAATFANFRLLAGRIHYR